MRDGKWEMREIVDNLQAAASRTISPHSSSNPRLCYNPLYHSEAYDPTNMVSYFLGSRASPFGSDAVLEAAEDCMDPPVCNKPAESHCLSVRAFEKASMREGKGGVPRFRPCERLAQDRRRARTQHPYGQLSQSDQNSSTKQPEVSHSHASLSLPEIVRRGSESRRRTETPSSSPDRGRWGSADLCSVVDSADLA